jgi:hypothetical protein
LTPAGLPAGSGTFGVAAKVLETNMVEATRDATIVRMEKLQSEKLGCRPKIKWSLCSSSASSVNLPMQP